MRCSPDPVPGLRGLVSGQARSALERAGWVVVGTGDWAVALADPTDTWCARVASFDPAYRLFADDLVTGPPNRWLPHVADVVPLEGEGYVVVMERLWPADAGAAQGFCDALGIPDETGGDEQPPSAAFPHATDPDFLALKPRIQALLAGGKARYPRLWGGSDIRAGNVMVCAAGDLKLVDPVFLAGPRVASALLAGDMETLADFTRAQLEAFLTIACFHREHDRYEVDDLRAALDRLEARPPR
jgi:hypothetical protein